MAARQKCLPDRCDSTEIYVQMSASQEILESQVNFLLNSLQLSPECSEVAGPFLCFYYFGLCDSSGELYLPSAGECETITTQTCAREFQIAVGILGDTSTSLPQCNTLLLSETDCNGEYYSIPLCFVHSFEPQVTTHARGQYYNALLRRVGTSSIIASLILHRSMC